MNTDEIRERVRDNRAMTSAEIVARQVAERRGRAEIAAARLRGSTCKCGAEYDPTPSGRHAHRQIHGHTPTEDT